MDNEVEPSACKIHSSEQKIKGKFFGVIKTLSDSHRS